MTKDKSNSVRRSIGRGAGARGSGINNNGKDAFKQALKNTRGVYRVEFTRIYENVTERDIDLRKAYAKDLIAQNIAVPADMINLQPKRKTAAQTLTAMDEVLYVKIGDVIYGKCSIRVQRLRKSNILIFIFQVKKHAFKPPQKAFSRNKGFKKRSASRKAQASRDSYHRRKK